MPCAAKDGVILVHMAAPNCEEPALLRTDGEGNPGMALNAIPGFRCVVLCGLVEGFQVLLGF